MAIQPQRTNDILERLFRDLKRRYRKKSGMNGLSKTLKAMLCDTPLVKNLENPGYLKIILDGAAILEERFSEIDARLGAKRIIPPDSSFRKSTTPTQETDQIAGTPGLVSRIVFRVVIEIQPLYAFMVFLSFMKNVG